MKTKLELATEVAAALSANPNLYSLSGKQIAAHAFATITRLEELIEEERLAPVKPQREGNPRFD